MKTFIASLAVAAATCAGTLLPATSASAQMATLGEIRAFAFNFCPRTWMQADGRLLPVSQYNALFSLYGTIYGGDGRTTFALPNLNGRTPIHNGNGPGLTPRPIGSMAGSDSVTLTTAQIPGHTHSAVGTGDPATQLAPTGALPAFAQTADGQEVGLYHDGPPDAQFNTGAITTTGNGMPHENRQPYLTLNYCVATQGIFPSRS